MKKLPAIIAITAVATLYFGVAVMVWLERHAPNFNICPLCGK